MWGAQRLDRGCPWNIFGIRFLNHGLDRAFACADLFRFSKHRSPGVQARGKLRLKLQARCPLLGATAPPQTVPHLPRGTLVFASKAAAAKTPGRLLAANR